MTTGVFSMSEKECHIFIDLESTIIEDLEFNASFSTATLIPENIKKIISYIKQQKHVYKKIFFHIFSFAIHNTKDREDFNAERPLLSLNKRLCDSLQIECFTNIVGLDTIHEFARKHKGMILDLHEITQFWGKEISFIEYVKYLHKVNNNIQTFILIDDMVDNIDRFWWVNNMTVNINTINIKDL